jgi:hypothetical protein
MFEVKSNIKKVTRALGTVEKDFKKAEARAANRTGGNVSTAARKMVRVIYQFKHSRALNEELKKKWFKKTKHATPLSPSAEITTKQDRQPGIQHFMVTRRVWPRRGPIKNRPIGMTVEVEKGQKKTIRHSFYLSKRGTGRGGEGVFTRWDGGSKVSRTPIKRLYGPGPAQMAANERVDKAMQAVADKKFPEHFDSALKSAKGGYFK